MESQYEKEYLETKKKAREIHKFLKNKNKQKATAFFLEIQKQINAQPNQDNWDEDLLNHEIGKRKIRIN